MTPEASVEPHTDPVRSQDPRRNKRKYLPYAEMVSQSRPLRVEPTRLCNAGINTPSVCDATDARGRPISDRYRYLWNDHILMDLIIRSVLESTWHFVPSSFAVAGHPPGTYLCTLSAVSCGAISSIPFSPNPSAHFLAIVTSECALWRSASASAVRMLCNIPGRRFLHSNGLNLDSGRLGRVTHW